MIVKAKDLQVGDRFGANVITAIQPQLWDIRVFYGEHSTDVLPDTELAIHREPMIKKRDGSMETFSKEKLKRSIYKAILDLPESEWDFSKVQQIVDDVQSLGFILTYGIRLYITGHTKWNWAKSYASYNK